MTLLPVVLLLVLASHGHGLGVEVEDVTGKQLEAALQTEQLLAVMFCKYLASARLNVVKFFSHAFHCFLFPSNLSHQPLTST